MKGFGMYNMLKQQGDPHQNETKNSMTKSPISQLKLFKYLHNYNACFTSVPKLFLEPVPGIIF